MALKKILFSCLLTFLASTPFAFSQMTLRFPVERTVFQRDNNNKGNINITGNLSLEADKVEAKLTPRVNGQGTATDWIVVDNNITALTFTGQLNAHGGWYQLDLRSKDVNGNILENFTLNRVGIGEVFLIAGQSNAQGYGNNINAKGAYDDRVNAALSVDINSNQLPNYQFSQLYANLNIAPSGTTSWCYGELGDLLSAKLNVPVLFFNAAISGTNLQNWIDSMYGRSTNIGFFYFPYGKPYDDLKKTIKNNFKLLGVRALLWHQGEYDSQTPSGTYAAKLNEIINYVRSDGDYNLPWVVARASRLFGQNYQNVIDGQNLVINNTPNVFAGPFTDNIQPNREDGAHFNNNNQTAGLSLLGQAWDQSLDNNFFANSAPLLATPMIEINYECQQNNYTKVYLDNSYSSFTWSQGINWEFFSTLNGNYTVITKDSKGLNYYSNLFKTENTKPQNPVISFEKSLTACTGKFVKLNTNSSKYTVNWNNGSSGSSIQAFNPVEYYAQYISKGCKSGYSNILTPKFVGPPAKPEISFLGSDGYVCRGTTLTASVNNPSNFETQWSTLSTAQSVNFDKELTKPLTVTLYSNYDCPSVASDSAKYLFVNIPETPSIVADGPFALQITTSKQPTYFDWYLNSAFVIKDTNLVFAPEKDGLYNLKSANSFTTPSKRVQTCFSSFSNTISYNNKSELNGMAVYPNPVVNYDIKISSQKEYKNIDLQLYNASGQLLTQKNFSGISPVPQKISLPAYLASGKYYLKVNFNGLNRVYNLVFE